MDVTRSDTVALEAALRSSAIRAQFSCGLGRNQDRRKCWSKWHTMKNVFSENAVDKIDGSNDIVGATDKN